MSALTKTCKHCAKTFLVREEDLAFLDRVSPVFAGVKHSVPPPTLCPSCRWQRRLTFRNERTLHHRKCDLSGKPMISMYPGETPFPVYYILEWQSDKWDPLSYGQKFDFSRPFFEQFKELSDKVPHHNLYVDPQRDINSEYTNCATESKNCYLISQAEENEDCYYSRGINHCLNCCDCLRIDHSELCYECINLSGCYHCLFCQDCDNCADCHFSTSLRGCKNCFACHNLYQKQYYFFNKPLSKEKWQKKVEGVMLTQESIFEMRKQSEALRLTVPHKAARIIQSEDCSGDHLAECRDSFQCYDSRKLEHCAYCYELLNGALYCYDYSMWGLDAELLYECTGSGTSAYHMLFCNHCWQSAANLLYCDSCFPAVKDCFGCCGLRHQQYCVLNKRYSQEEYEKLVPQIIHHMEETGEWGEFFSPSVSPFGYNETIAHDYFPLGSEEVLSRGWQWRADYRSSSAQELKAADLPHDIQEVNESVCTKILRCEDSGKAYKVIQPEFRYYQKLGIPLPRKSPERRHQERVMRRNPRKLWQRNCDRCGNTVQTTYAPHCPETIYCEQCYVEEVY